eukprot:1838472-Amphidinium_carterae.1
MTPSACPNKAMRITSLRIKSALRPFKLQWLAPPILAHASLPRAVLPTPTARTSHKRSSLSLDGVNVPP